MAPVYAEERARRKGVRRARPSLVLGPFHVRTLRDARGLIADLAMDEQCHREARVAELLVRGPERHCVAGRAVGWLLLGVRLHHAAEQVEEEEIGDIQRAKTSDRASRSSCGESILGADALTRPAPRGQVRGVFALANPIL